MGGIEVALRGAVVGQVQSGEGEDGEHDVVALEADLDNGYPPEVADARVGREGGAGAGGEVVEKFELQVGEVISLRLSRSRRCGRRRVCC